MRAMPSVEWGEGDVNEEKFHFHFWNVFRPTWPLQVACVRFGEPMNT